MAAGCLPRSDVAGTDTALVVCQACSFSYPGPTPVLEDVNLVLRRGNLLAVLGPSGAGKSTLLRLLGGLLEPSSGTIVRAVPRAAFVFQAAGLLPWLTAAKNVLLPLRLAGVEGRAAAERALAALERVGLTPARNLFPHQLSIGMAKRVELARLIAVAELSPLWLLDEPFESVDLPTRIKLQQILAAEAARWQPGVVLVTHSREEALRLGTRFAVLCQSTDHRSHTLRYINGDDLVRADPVELAEMFRPNLGPHR